jgi:hypothetical protein
VNGARSQEDLPPALDWCDPFVIHSGDTIAMGMGTTEERQQCGRTRGHLGFAPQHVTLSGIARRLRYRAKNLIQFGKYTLMYAELLCQDGMLCTVPLGFG